MNFQEAERTYKDLKAQHDAGKLNDAAFETEVGKLRLQDEQGRWWQIGVQTGEWYMHDGQKWNKAKPPTPVLPPAPVQEKAPLAPAPKPIEKKPEPKPESKPKGGAPNLPARLLSSKPAGREGGLSRPVLIGIIAAVAVIILLLLVGIYFVANNFLGGTPKPTVTPTRVSLVLPTVPPPTVAPTLRPTDIPLPPTPVITATVPLTIPVATRTRAAVSPTATRRPGTPVPPSPTLPNVPSGVYATKVETNPAKANIGDTVALKVTFLNTTGSMQTYKVMVKVYQCPEQCQDFKHAYGETLRADFNLPAGTSTIVTSQNINFGVGIRCDLVIIPHFIDPTNQQVVPFPATNNPNGLYQPIQLCR